MMLKLCLLALSIVLFECEQCFAADELRRNYVGPDANANSDTRLSHYGYRSGYGNGNRNCNRQVSYPTNNHRGRDVVVPQREVYPVNYGYSRDQNWQKAPTNRRDAMTDVLVSCPTRPSTGKVGSTGIQIFYHVSNRDYHIQQGPNVRWRQKDVDYLVKNGFDVNKRTLIYMHGWQRDNEALWLLRAREDHDKLAAMNKGESMYNLLIVDWSDYNTFNYGQSASNVPYMAQVTTDFVEQLIDRHGYKAEQVEFVSYSLSTHIAGLVGRQLQTDNRGTVRQITALDPTGVCFHGSRNAFFDNEYSLRPTDAKLVVARHYNMNQLGAGRMIGGVDVVVNGGQEQPIMDVQSMRFLDVVGAKGPGVRHHFRAVQHEENSFQPGSECHEMAYECSSAKKFKQGQCADCGPRNQSCLLVSTVGNIYLGQEPSQVGYRLGTEMHMTTGVAQFCVYHYQVVARLRPNAPAPVVDSFKDGRFKFPLNKKLLVQPKYRMREDRNNVAFTRLVRSNRRITKYPRRIEMGSTSADLEQLRALDSISINFMSNISPDVRSNNSARYCADLSNGSALVRC